MAELIRTGPAPVILTARLELRELNVDDAPFVLQLLNDPSFLRYIGDRGVRNLEEARATSSRAWCRATSGTASACGWSNCCDDGHRPIGLCGLVSREGLPAPDIGFALLPDWWSQGLALEAATRGDGARAARRSASRACSRSPRCRTKVPCAC